MLELALKKDVQTGWNCLSTAPLATPVLLAFPEHDTGLVVVREGFKWDIANAPVYYCEDYGSVDPTHWQSLPPPPVTV